MDEKGWGSNEWRGDVAGRGNVGRNEPQFVHWTGPTFCCFLIITVSAVFLDAEARSAIQLVCLVSVCPTASTQE